MKWSNFTNFKVKRKKNFQPHSIDLPVRECTKLTTLNTKGSPHRYYLADELKKIIASRAFLPSDPIFYRKCPFLRLFYFTTLFTGSLRASLAIAREYFFKKKHHPFINCCHDVPADYLSVESRKIPFPRRRGNIIQRYRARFYSFYQEKVTITIVK